MVTAILGALGSITGAIGSIISSNNARKIVYQNWLSQNVPTYTDIFGNYKTENDKNNLTIIAILAGLIIILIIAIVIKSNRNEK